MRTILAATIVLAAFVQSASTALAKDARRPFLISGYDDVVRQANNTGLVRAFLRSFSKDETFAGMPELYRILAEPSETGFVVVSATSSMYEDDAESFLRDFGYPSSTLNFRSWLTQWSAEKFKYAQIEEAFSARPGRAFLLVFDNSETSRNLSTLLLHEHSAIVSAIYLRETVNRDAVAQTVSFITAFDIAANEFAEGRISSEELATVATAIVDEQSPVRIIPEYAHCPIDYTPCRTGMQAGDYCSAVQAKVRSICASRRPRL